MASILLGVAPEFLSSSCDAGSKVASSSLAPLPPPLAGVAPLRPSHLIPSVTGTAALAFSSNGLRYEGDLVNGVPHGRGSISLADGSRYSGGFVRGRLQGRGTLSFPDGSEYKGEVDGGLRHGRGTLIFEGGTARYVGEWVRGRREGRGTLFYGPLRRDGTSACFYRGQWRGDAREGQGLLRYASGNFYSGGWAADRKSGLGRFVWSDLGEEYVGEWAEDLPEGNGVHTWFVALPSNTELPQAVVAQADAAIAQARAQRSSSPTDALLHLLGGGKDALQFDNINSAFSSPSASGMLSLTAASALALRAEAVLPEPEFTSEADRPFAGFVAGSRYRGRFSRGYRHGFGTFFYSNGSRYCGEWVADRKQSHGVWCAQDGSVFEGIFWNDQPWIMSSAGGPDPSTVTLQQVEQRMRAAASSITQASVLEAPRRGVVAGSGNNGNEATSTMAGTSLAAATATASLPNPASSLKLKVASLVRPLGSEPLFALHISDLLPTDESLLSWYSGQHPQLSRNEIEGDGPLLTLRMRAHAVQLVENVMLRWNSRLSGWYSAYSKLARAGSLGSVLFATEDSAEASALAPGNCAGSGAPQSRAFLPPSHAAVVEGGSALRAYFTHLVSSIDVGESGLQPPTLRLHQLWRLCVDSGIIQPPAVSLASISEMLLSIRARHAKAVIEASGRLAALASRLLQEQRTELFIQRQQAQQLVDVGRGGSASSNQQGDIYVVFEGEGAQRPVSSFASEEKKSDEYIGPSPAQGALARALGQLPSANLQASASSHKPATLELPNEAAEAVSAIVRSELAHLQNAQRACHDPDSPVLFREFAEVLVRISAARSRGMEAKSSLVQEVLTSEQVTFAQSLSPQKARDGGGLSGVSADGDSSILASELNLSSIGGGPNSRGSAIGSASSTVASRAAAATATYGRLRKDHLTATVDNSHLAISHAPRLPLGDTNGTFSAEGFVSQPSSSSTSFPPPASRGGPEDLAYSVEVMLWERLLPFALSPTLPQAPQKPATREAGAGRSSGYGTARASSRGNTASLSTSSPSPTPLSSIDPIRAVTHPSALSASKVLVAASSAQASQAARAAEASAMASVSSAITSASAKALRAAADEAAERANALPPSALLCHPDLEASVCGERGATTALLFRSICEGSDRRETGHNEFAHVVPSEVSAAVAVLSLSVPLELESHDTAFVSPPPHYFGATTIGDVMRAFAAANDLIEPPPTALQETEVLVFLGRLASHGALDGVGVGDRFRQEAASAAALALQRAAATPASAAPVPTQPPASPSKAGSKVGSVAPAPDPALIAATEAAAARARVEAEARAELARGFVGRCVALQGLRELCAAACSATPFFGPLAVLRALYSSVRPHTSVVDAERAAVAAITPMPEASSAVHGVASEAGAVEHVPADSASEVSGGGESLMTSATGSPAYLSAAPSRSLGAVVPAAIQLSSDDRAGPLLSTDVLDLRMVKCEFVEGLLRCCALLTATVAARREHCAAMQAKLRAAADDALRAAYEEAGVEFAALGQQELSDGGGRAELSKEGEGMRVAALAEIESEIDFLLRRTTAHLRLLSSRGPFRPPPETDAQRAAREAEEDARDHFYAVTATGRPTSVVQLLDEHGNALGDPVGGAGESVSRPATTVPAGRGEGGGGVTFDDSVGSREDATTRERVQLPRPAYVPPVDRGDAAALAAAAVPVVLEKLSAAVAPKNSPVQRFAMAELFEE